MNQADILVPPHFRSSVRCSEPEETAMKKLLVAALIAGSFISAEARAQELLEMLPWARCRERSFWDLWVR